MLVLVPCNDSREVTATSSDDGVGAANKDTTTIVTAAGTIPMKSGITIGRMHLLTSQELACLDCDGMEGEFRPPCNICRRCNWMRSFGMEKPLLKVKVEGGTTKLSVYYQEPGNICCYLSQKRCSPASSDAPEVEIIPQPGDILEICTTKSLYEKPHELQFKFVEEDKEAAAAATAPEIANNNATAAAAMTTAAAVAGTTAATKTAASKNHHAGTSKQAVKGASAPKETAATKASINATEKDPSSKRGGATSSQAASKVAQKDDSPGPPTLVTPPAAQQGNMNTQSTAPTASRTLGLEGKSSASNVASRTLPTDVATKSNTASAAGRAGKHRNGSNSNASLSVQAASKATRKPAPPLSRKEKEVGSASTSRGASSKRQKTAQSAASSSFVSTRSSKSSNKAKKNVNYAEVQDIRMDEASNEYDRKGTVRWTYESKNVKPVQAIHLGTGMIVGAFGSTKSAAEFLVRHLGATSVESAQQGIRRAVNQKTSQNFLGFGWQAFDGTHVDPRKMLPQDPATDCVATKDQPSSVSKTTKKAKTRKVNCFSLNNPHKLLKCFKSVRSAAMSTAGTTEDIEDCCNGYEESANGYIWKWAKNDDDGEEESSNEPPSKKDTASISSSFHHRLIKTAGELGSWLKNDTER
jgi:hypothetical protein